MNVFTCDCLLVCEYSISDAFIWCQTICGKLTLLCQTLITYESKSIINSVRVHLPSIRFRSLADPILMTVHKQWSIIDVGTIMVCTLVTDHGRVQRQPNCPWLLNNQTRQISPEVRNRRFLLELLCCYVMLVVYSINTYVLLCKQAMLIVIKTDLSIIEIVPLLFQNALEFTYQCVKTVCASSMFSCFCIH